MKHSLLWKIKHPESLYTSYLFGTMHVRDAKVFQKLEMVYTAIRECDAFAAEYSLDDSQQGLPSGIMQLPNGQRITDLLPPKQYKKLRQILKKTYGFDIAQLGHLLPFFVTNIISQKILSEDMPLALDQHLWEFARGEERILTGIETFQEQISILQSIPISLQVRSLLKISSNVSAYRRQLLHLTAVYQTKDIQKIHKVAKKQIGGLRKLMLHQRNELMSTRIASAIAQQSVFVAIGAAHLGGAKGVLRQLKQQGYHIQPVFDV